MVPGLKRPPGQGARTRNDRRALKAGDEAFDVFLSKIMLPYGKERYIIVIDSLTHHMEDLNR